MKIEKAKSEQIELLAKEIWNEHYSKILSKEQIDYMLENFQSQKAIDSQIKDGYNYFVMKADGETLGYTGVVFQESKMFLSKLYIKKEARNKGVGRNTLEFLKNLCREKGYNKIYLTVNKYNTDSINAYKKMGFEIINSVVSDIGNGYVMDDYIMELCF